MSNFALGSSPIYVESADPNNPGWTLLELVDRERFAEIFGPIRFKVEGPAHVRFRIQAETRHLNIIGSIHGGFALAFIDQLLFLGPQALGIKGGFGGLTLDISTQFFGPLHAGAPIDGLVEVLRETGRLIFLRGLIEQDGKAAVAFSGTVRKASQR